MKGSPIIVQGEMDLEIFTNREGKSQISAGITAHNIMFSPFGRTDQAGQTTDSQPKEENIHAKPLLSNEPFDAEEEIPFVMIKITHISDPKKRKRADVAICPVWKTKIQAQIALELQEFDTLIKISLDDFSGEKGKTLLLYREKGVEKRVLLLGLGEKANCQTETLRQAYASAIKQLRAKKNQEL